jgi:thiol-disulfide isomerase/thioredoxin
MRNSFFLIIAIICFSCTGNDISSKGGLDRAYEDGRIYGRIEQLPGRKVFLSGLFGDQVNLIDSAMARADGSFEFLMSPTGYKGLYRLSTGKPGRHGQSGQQPRQFDLIWDGSTVVFQTHYSAPADSMQILLSEENRLYYQFLGRMHNYDRKIQVLTNALLNYPPNNSVNRRLEREYRKVQNRRTNYIDNLVKKNKGTIFSSLARFYKLPALPLPGDEDNLAELKLKFFQKDQFSDPVLLHTDLIPRRLLHYLSLYTTTPDDDDEELQYELIQAADVIMHNAMANEDVYYYVVEYMINGFERMGFTILADHLRDRYLLSEVCFEEGTIIDQASSVLPSKRLKKGDKVPDFGLTTVGGQVINLSDISAEYTLLVFWGSWCPHCENVMDDLVGIYNDYNEKNEGFLEIVAIGIEDDRQIWLSRIEEGRYNWINHTSLQRWECPVAREYNIRGTPTMILLDSEKRFINEPLRIRALKRYLPEPGQ